MSLSGFVPWSWSLFLGLGALVRARIRAGIRFGFRLGLGALVFKSQFFVCVLTHEYKLRGSGLLVSFLSMTHDTTKTQTKTPRHQRYQYQDQDQGSSNKIESVCPYMNGMVSCFRPLTTVWS